MTSCLFRKHVPRPRSVSARCWNAGGGRTCSRLVTGSPLLEYTLPHTTHLSSLPISIYTQHTPCPTDSHHSTQTDLHVDHTPSRMHTSTMHATHYTSSSPNISHKHISTHGTMIAHTHAPRLKDMQTPRGIYRHTQSLPISVKTASHKSHTHSSRGRAVGIWKKLQALKCITWSFFFFFKMCVVPASP